MTKITEIQNAAMMARMVFLPGFDKLTPRAMLEYYRVLSGSYPHEVMAAIDKVLASPDITWVPSPGQILKRVQDARNAHCVHSWEELEPLLERAEQQFLRERSDYRELLGGPEQLEGPE